LRNRREPALGLPFVGVDAPEFGVCVDGGDGDDDHGALWNEYLVNFLAIDGFDGLGKWQDPIGVSSTFG
jgi:hypothetical protein